MSKDHTTGNSSFVPGLIAAAVLIAAGGTFSALDDMAGQKGTSTGVHRELGRDHVVGARDMVRSVYQRSARKAGG